MLKYIHIGDLVLWQIRAHTAKSAPSFLYNFLLSEFTDGQ